MTQSPLVNTFLIGAQKSGTTYLAALLGQSDQVCVSEPKEPQFFSQHFSDGLDSYHRIFADPNATITLDASTSYSFLRAPGAGEDAPGLPAAVAQRIRDYNPQAKILYIMRNPVERCKSALRHKARRYDHVRGQVSILEEMRKNPMLELISTYSVQAQIYLDLFPRDQVLFLSFNDLRSDPQAVLDQVCDFLDIAPITLTDDDADAERNAGFVYRGKSKVLFRALSRAPALKAVLKAVLPVKWIKAKLTRDAGLEFTDTAAAEAYFAAERQRVFDLTGVKI